MNENAAEVRSLKAQLKTRNIQATKVAKMVQDRDIRIKAMDDEKKAAIEKERELRQKAVDQAREDEKAVVKEA